MAWSTTWASGLSPCAAMTARSRCVRRSATVGKAVAAVRPGPPTVSRVGTKPRPPPPRVRSGGCSSSRRRTRERPRSAGPPGSFPTTGRGDAQERRDDEREPHGGHPRGPLHPDRQVRARLIRPGHARLPNNPGHRTGPPSAAKLDGGATPSDGGDCLKATKVNRESDHQLYRPHSRCQLPRWTLREIFHKVACCVGERSRRLRQALGRASRGQKEVADLQQTLQTGPAVRGWTGGAEIALTVREGFVITLLATRYVL